VDLEDPACKAWVLCSLPFTDLFISISGARVALFSLWADGYIRILRPGSRTR